VVEEVIMVLVEQVVLVEVEQVIKMKEQQELLTQVVVEVEEHFLQDQVQEVQES
jgi:hypothetical protein